MVLSQKIVNHRNTFWILALIALLVVLVRCIVFLVYPENAPHVERLDPDGWLTIARNVVDGHGYTHLGAPTAKRGPTVVYFFTAVIWIAGDHLWSIVIAQWLVDVATSIILFFIALEIFQDRRVALTTSLLFALYGSGLVYTFSAWSEPVFTLVLAAFTWSFLRALREPSFWRFALCGALFGLAVLARPVMQYYPLVVLPLMVWMLAGYSGSIIARYAVFCGVFAAILLPWVVRNYRVFDAFIPGSSISGTSFYQGNFTLAQADYLRYRTVAYSNPALRQVLEARFGPATGELDLNSYASAKGLNEYQVDRIALHETLKIIAEFPGRYTVASLMRLVRFWFGNRFVALLQGRGSLWSYPVPLANGTLLVLAVIGIIWYRGPWLRSAVPLIVLVSYTAAVYSATLVLARYSVPIMPYVMILAAYTIVRLFSKSTRRAVVAN